MTQTTANRRTRPQAPTTIARSDARSEAGEWLNLMVERIAAGDRDEEAAGMGYEALEANPSKREAARAHANLAIVFLNLGDVRSHSLYKDSLSHAWKAIRTDGSLVTPYLTLLEAALRSGDVRRIKAAWRFWQDASVLQSAQVRALLDDDWELDRSRRFVDSIGGGSTFAEAMGCVRRNT